MHSRTFRPRTALPQHENARKYLPAVQREAGVSLAHSHRRELCSMRLYRGAAMKYEAIYQAHIKRAENEQNEKKKRSFD